MHSAEYVITLTNLVKLFTSVKYSIEFLMFDIFGYFTFDIFGKYRCEKFGRIFHMRCQRQFKNACIIFIPVSF